MTEQRRAREKEKRKQEILHAATTRFFENPYDQVIIEDIAKDVELAKGTIYNYFENKQTLFFAVVIQGMQLLLNTFLTAVEREKTGKGKVIQITQAFYEYIQVHSDYYRLNLAARSPRFTAMHMSGEIKNTREYVTLTEDLLNIIQDAVKQGIQDGTLSNDLNPIQTSLFLGSAIESAVYISPEYKLLLEQLKITTKTYLLHSIDILLKGISSSKEDD